MHVVIHETKVFNGVIPEGGDKPVPADIHGNVLNFNGDEESVKKAMDAGFWSRDELTKALKEVEVEAS